MTSSYIPTYAMARQIALTWSKTKLQQQAYLLRQASPERLQQLIEEKQAQAPPPPPKKFQFEFPAGVEDPRSLSDILHQDLALYARYEHRIMLRVHEAIVRSDTAAASPSATAYGGTERQHDGEEQGPLTLFQIGFPPGVEDPRSLSAIKTRQRLWRQRFVHSAARLACDW